jgi:uncharacterized protein YjiS (DUF1127 family)
MMDIAGSLENSNRSEFLWFMRTALESAARATDYFIALMKQAAVRERTRKELAELDARTLRDIGLEPFDVYRGPRLSGCADR